MVTGVDGGVSRRPWDLRQRHLLLEYWWLEAVEKGVSHVGEEKKGSVSPVSGGRRRRRRPWPARMGATLVMVIVGVGFVREREIRNLRGFSLRRKGLRLPHPFQVIGSSPFVLHLHLPP